MLNDAESLADVQYKQNVNRGLTHISDKFFSFFKNLYLASAPHLHEDYFHLHQSNTNKELVIHLNKNSEILRDWFDLFTFATDEEDEVAHEILLCALLDIGEIGSFHWTAMNSTRHKSFLSSYYPFCFSDTVGNN